MREPAAVRDATPRLPRRPGASSPFARIPLLLLLAAGLPGALLQGCSSGQGGFAGLGFGGGDAKKAEGVFYSGAAGLAVHKAADPSSPVVAKLALHEKVTRTRLEKGYALVATEGGKKKGWVLNARLLWKLPKAAASAGTGAPASAAMGAPAPAEAGAPAEAEAGAAATETPADSAATPGSTVEEATTTTPAEDEPTPAEPAPPAEEPGPGEPAQPAPKPGRVGASVFDPY